VSLNIVEIYNLDSIMFIYYNVFYSTVGATCFGFRFSDFILPIFTMVRHYEHRPIFNTGENEKLHILRE